MHKTIERFVSVVLVTWAGLALVACSDDSPASANGGHAGGGQAPTGQSGPPGGGGPGGPRSGSTAAVPVEVAAVERRSISSFIETNGTLEAENEVDIVARVTGPITALQVEEGMPVSKGQVLARLDDRELRAQAEISRANLREAEQAYARAETLRESQLISPEDHEAAVARVETARAQFESDRIELGYTEIAAPFGGLIVARYIDLAQQVSNGTALFRISDFTPLLCPIQVPERDLQRLRLGQQAYLTFEAWPDQRFSANVLRIRPVVDAATGTVRVTLEVDAQGKLRPGMFARVFVETEVRDNSLVIPKAALSLESIGDTVYVAGDSVASRRSVELGFQEADLVEVVSGVEEGEMVIVVGQDGLSEGTPIQVLAGAAGAPALQMAPGEGRPDASAGEPGQAGGGFGGRRPDFAKMTPEQLERAKEFMRARGMTEEEIEKRIERAKSGQ